ncbi:MAG: hypothetical protein ACOH2E_03895 [Candidatus Paracaedibacter sp.]
MMMNRNQSSYVKETHHIKIQAEENRRRRTVTLIEVGGLLSLSGLLEQCNISLGEKLRSDLEGYEKAATLLGILIEASEMLLNEENKMEIYKELGVKKLKQSGAKYS